MAKIKIEVGSYRKTKRILLRKISKIGSRSKILDNKDKKELYREGNDSIIKAISLSLLDPISQMEEVETHITQYFDFLEKAGRRAVTLFDSTTLNCLHDSILHKQTELILNLRKN